ncbi:MAG: FmdB family zinc ribbon protein [Deltaproteobacteria bacterium]
MPLYEYRCRKCGNVVEKIQKFSDAPLTRCEKCGGKLEKLLSPPAIQFKGSGWYVTDYARKSSPGPSGSNGGSGSGDGAKSDSKTKAEKPGAPAPAAKK